MSDLVRIGGQPASISASTIEHMRTREDPLLGAYVWRREFLQGQRVKFIDGPFSGLETIYQADTGEDRALVLLDFLGKSNQLEVERDWMIEVD